MKFQTARLIISVVLSVWLAWVQPGLSYFWLIDSHVHADMDAKEYGQTTDGRTLPGQPWHPPHQHPSSDSLSVSDLVQQNVFNALFYATVFSPAARQSLSDKWVEVEVIAAGINVLPPISPRAFEGSLNLFRVAAIS